MYFVFSFVVVHLMWRQATPEYVTSKYNKFINYLQPDSSSSSSSELSISSDEIIGEESENETMLSGAAAGAIESRGIIGDIETLKEIITVLEAVGEKVIPVIEGQQPPKSLIGGSGAGSAFTAAASSASVKGPIGLKLFHALHNQETGNVDEA